MSKPTVFEVADGVYCVMRRSYFTCSYLVVTPAGLVAVDAGMKSSGTEMLRAIDELGRNVAEVRAILLTHWHNDHAAGASALAELSGAEVYYSAREARHLTRETASSGLRGRLSSIVPETGPMVLLKGLLGNAPQQPVEATQWIKGGETVANDFDVMETPGHTSGHLSYYYRSGRVLFAGDCLAVIRGRLRFMARPVTEDVAQARQSMLRCLELPIDAVCPGHREPLVENVPAECWRMREYIRQGGPWPLLG